MPTGKPLAENQYAKAFQLGEEHAYNYFFRHYFPSLCYFANNILRDLQESEDLVQECFIKLWQKHTELKKPSAIRSFLYTTVRNASIDLLRRRKAKRITFEDLSESVLDNCEPLYNEAMIKAELLQQLDIYISELPTRIREVCQLYYIEGKNDWDICELLDTSYHTVRNQRQRAIRLLKDKVGLN